MGCDGMKKFTHVGPVAEVVHELMDIATALNAHALCDAGTRADDTVPQKVSVRLLGEVSFPKRAAEPVDTVVALKELQTFRLQLKELLNPGEFAPILGTKPQTEEGEEQRMASRAQS
eukprot:gene45099-61248_t